jgi:hypothetical protein
MIILKWAHRKMQNADGGLMRFMAAISIVLLFGARVLVAAGAESYIDDYSGLVAKDYERLASWYADQMARATGAYAGAHAMDVPVALGRGRFEASVLGGLTFSRLDAKALENLKLDTMSNTQMASTMGDRIPLPQWRARLHVGLPGSNDLGAHFGRFQTTLEKMQIQMQSFGAEFRSDLMSEGVLHPFSVMAGLGFDYTKGVIQFSDTYASQSLGEWDAQQYLQQTRIRTTLRNESEDFALQARLAVSKRMLFLRPYLGGSIQMNHGSAHTTLRSEGTITLVNPQNSADTAVQNYLAEGKATSPVPSFDARLGAGAHMQVFMVQLSLGGEYGLASGDQAYHLSAGVWF